MRGLLTTVLVVFALLLGGDFLVRRAVEGHLEDRLTTALKTDGRVDVALPSFPLTLKLLGGRLDKVEATASGISTEALAVSDLHAVARNVSFSFGDLLQGKGRVRVGRASATGAVTEDAVNQALSSAGTDVTVILDGETVRVSSPGLPGEATGTLEIEGDELLIVAGGMTVVRLAAAPASGDLTLRRAVVRDSQIDLEFGLSARVFSASRG